MINELELCTEITKEDNTLTELQSEQQKLEQQQVELKLKEIQIKQKLAEREEKAMLLKKELFINENEVALDKNVKAYNDLLTVLNCNTQVIKTKDEKPDFKSKDMDVIKSHYINVVKEITSTYLKKLNKCSIGKL